MYWFIPGDVVLFGKNQTHTVFMTEQSDNEFKSVVVKPQTEPIVIPRKGGIVHLILSLFISKNHR